MPPVNLLSRQPEIGNPSSVRNPIPRPRLGQAQPTSAILNSFEASAFARANTDSGPLQVYLTSLI
jgi:hypothetical protein